MNKRLILFVSALSLLSIFFTACATPTSTPAPATGATDEPTQPAAAPTEAVPEEETMTEVVIGVADDTFVLEGDGATLGIFPYQFSVNESLIKQVDDQSLHPWLAESWEYMGDNTWLVHLRHGVMFHNGEEMKAEHVLWSLRKSHRRIPFIPTTEEGYTAIDDYTIQIVTTEAFSDVPRLLSYAQTFPIYHPDGDPGSSPIGTGPFSFDEYVQNEFFRMVKFDNYWGEPKAAVDAITFRFLPDNSARILALQSGDVDMSSPVPLENVVALRDTPGIEVAVSRPALIRYMPLATNDMEPPFDTLTDKNLRHAISYAIDREELSAIYDGIATPAYYGFTVSPVINDAIEGFRYDPEQAMALLEESGWIDTDGDGVREKDGEPLHIVLLAGYPSAEALKPLPEVVQAQLAAVGIEMEIVEVNDWPVLYEMIAEPKNYHMMMEEAGARADGLSAAYNFYCGCAGSVSSSYVHFWINDEYDQAVLDARAIIGDALSGDEEKLEAVIRVHSMWLEYTNFVPLVYFPRAVAYNTKIQGFEIYGDPLYQTWAEITVVE